MKIKDKQLYVAPSVALLRLQHPLHLLVSVSAEAGFVEWEEGDDL